MEILLSHFALQTTPLPPSNIPALEPHGLVQYPVDTKLPQSERFTRIEDKAETNLASPVILPLCHHGRRSAACSTVEARN